jgi:hypothetical protein
LFLLSLWNSLSHYQNKQIGIPISMVSVYIVCPIYATKVCKVPEAEVNLGNLKVC